MSFDADTPRALAALFTFLNTFHLDIHLRKSWGWGSTATMSRLIDLGVPAHHSRASLPSNGPTRVRRATCLGRKGTLGDATSDFQSTREIFSALPKCDRKLAQLLVAGVVCSGARKQLCNLGIDGKTSFATLHTTLFTCEATRALRDAWPDVIVLRPQWIYLPAAFAHPDACLTRFLWTPTLTTPWYFTQMAHVHSPHSQPHATPLGLWCATTLERLRTNVPLCVVPGTVQICLD